MNFGAVPVATIWLQNFNQITVSVKIHGINAQKAYYKCILLLPVKYLSWSGNNFHVYIAQIKYKLLAFYMWKTH